MPELEKCPFCGSPKVYVANEHCVVCTYCEATGPVDPRNISARTAIEKWNRRAPDPIREELATACRAFINASDLHGFAKGHSLKIAGEMIRAALAKHEKAGGK